MIKATWNWKFMLSTWSIEGIFFNKLIKIEASKKVSSEGKVEDFEANDNFKAVTMTKFASHLKCLRRCLTHEN